MWSAARRAPNPYTNLEKNATSDVESSMVAQDSDLSDVSDVFTLDQALDMIGVGRAQWKLIVICGCWWAADAMEVMLLSFLLPQLESAWKLKGWQSALIVASTFCGILLGSFAWGVVADNPIGAHLCANDARHENRLGRKKGYLATTLFTSVFGVASCFSSGFVSMILLRGVLGFGIGGSPVAFSMLSEFLPRNNRGTFLIFFEAFWTVGTIVEVLLAWVVLPTLGWRWLLAFSSIPLWLLLACYPFLPESPRYLLISGDYERAEQVLRDTAKMNGTQLPPHARLDRGDASVAKFTLAKEPSGANASWKEEVRGNFPELLYPGVRRLTLLLWVLWIAHAVIYYGNVLFTPKFYGSHSQDGAKKSWLNLYVFVLLTTLAELPGLFGAAVLVEKLGRRKTMASMLGVCVGALFCLFWNPPGWLGMILLAVSRMGINGSMATLWIFTPEAYPTTLRATGLGVANSLSKLATTGTPFISTALPDQYLWVAVLIFGLCCIGGIIAALLLPFDTKDSILPSTLNALKALRHTETKDSEEDHLEMETILEEREDTLDHRKEQVELEEVTF